MSERSGARLKADQAEADTRVARARAEMRRAHAVALEQEKVASIQESRAKVIESESEVPRPLPRVSDRGDWAFSTTTRFETLKPTRKCANQWLPVAP